MNRAAVRSAASNQPGGLLLSPRVPTRRNVYEVDCRSERRDLKEHGPRRRQGNQKPSGLLISVRVPPSRNVYEGDCRSELGFCLFSVSTIVSLQSMLE